MYLQDPLKFNGPSLKTLLDPFIAFAEICRRCMWGMLRLENEHLNNLEGELIIYIYIDNIVMDCDYTKIDLVFI